MPGPLHPQGLHGPGAALVHGQAMGEVDDLILCPVDDQHGRSDFGYLVNAAERGGVGRDRPVLAIAAEHTCDSLALRREAASILEG